MIKSFWLAILFFFPAIVEAQNDSLDYKVKFSLGYNCFFTSVKYSETSGSSENFMSDNKKHGSTDILSSYNSRNKIPPVLFPELNIDFQLPKHFKITLGLLVNKVNFYTPVISSTEKDESYIYKGCPNCYLDSTITTYSVGPTHHDSINLMFLGTSLGLGYTVKKNRFLFDFDAGIKVLQLIKGIVQQKYPYYPPCISCGSSESDYNLRDKGNQQGSHSTKIVAYYAKASVAYRLWKKLYYNVGFSYTKSFIPLHGQLAVYFNSETVYKYSFSIQQFAIHSGLTLGLK